MKTPPDPEPLPTGLGKKLEPPKPSTPRERENWEPVPDQAGYERHIVTGAIRKMHLWSMAVALGLIAGCASLPQGVKVHPGDLESCQTEGCTLWTERELLDLFRTGVLRGIQAEQARGKGT